MREGQISQGHNVLTVKTIIVENILDKCLLLYSILITVLHSCEISFYITAANEHCDLALKMLPWADKSKPRY